MSEANPYPTLIPALRERVGADEVVVNSWSNSEIVEIIARKGQRSATIHVAKTLIRQALSDGGGFYLMRLEAMFDGLKRQLE